MSPKDPDEEALEAWAASFADGKNPFDDPPKKAAPTPKPTPKPAPKPAPQAAPAPAPADEPAAEAEGSGDASDDGEASGGAGDDEAAMAAWAASFSEGAAEPPAQASPSRGGGLRPAVLIFAVLVVGASLWYLVGGGRSTVERLLNRTSQRARLTAKESVDAVRAYRAGPQNMSSLERLEVVADRLDLHGIAVTERRWDCTTEGEASTVTCVLRGAGYENQFQWKVDRESGDVTPANGPASDLDEFDVDALQGRVAVWDPHGGTAPPDAPVAQGGPSPHLPSGAALPRAPGGRPSAHPSAAAPAPDADELVLVGVIATTGGGKALFHTPKGQKEVALGKNVGKWTLSEINHRSNGESTVILRHADGVRELRMSQRRTSGPAAGGPRHVPSASPHTPPSGEADGPPPEAEHRSPPAGEAAPPGEPHGPPPSGAPPGPPPSGAP